jgi:hypothetical protein
MTYTYNKKCNLDLLTKEIEKELRNLLFLNGEHQKTNIHFSIELSIEDKTILDTIVENHEPIRTIDNIRNIVNSAIDFGNQVMREFIIENVSLGITQRGLTSHVRRVTSDLIQCLITGSLYDAITEVKMINPDDLDPLILSEERLLAFRNKIHTYLGIPAATTWNE